MAPAARLARAAGGRLDAAQSTPERVVGRLDGIDQERAVGPLVLDVQEGGVALELGQAERRLEPADDRLQEVAGDGRRVLQLAAGQVGGVAGEVGDDEEAMLGVAAMRGTLDPGVAPMSRGRKTTLPGRYDRSTMEHLHRVIGPIATNVHVLADERTGEAIAIDTATPCLAWIADELAARDWTLKLIVTHPRALGPHRRQRRGRGAHRRRHRGPSARRAIG